IENLWKDFKQLFDKKIELNPDFSFNKMVMEIHELLAEGKEAIQEWVNKEKKKELESEVDEDNENKENTNINNNILIVIKIVVIVKLDFCQYPKNTYK
ncbi:13760_t:CDS:2, partial [Funneliformis geosporum]